MDEPEVPCDIGGEAAGPQSGETTTSLTTSRQRSRAFARPTIDDGQLTRSVYRRLESSTPCFMGSRPLDCALPARLPHTSLLQLTQHRIILVVAFDHRLRIGSLHRLLEESAGWLWIGGRKPSGYGRREGRNPALIERFRSRLPELFEA